MAERRTGDNPDSSEADLLQIVPTAAPRGGGKGSSGGYDCELVELPPAAFQTACPVCHLFLREPHLISCCGQKICRQCLDPDNPEKTACKLCGEPEFTHLQDRGLERSMKELEARCTYKKEGCEWSGKLGELELHLNRGCDPENQPRECQFVGVACQYRCGEWFQRRHIAAHESKQCPKRPYTCDHCQTYKAVYDDVVQNHYSQCKKYPVACPNKCREFPFERHQLETHFQEECPLVQVVCPYQYAGCKAELVRKDVLQHIEVETSLHLTLLATVTESLVKTSQELRGNVGLVHELNVKQVSMMTECSSKHQQLEQAHGRALQELNRHIVQLTATADVLVKENKELREEKDREVRELMKKLSAAQEGIENLKEEVKTLKVDTVQHSEFPKEFRVKVTSIDMITPAFYTHPHGYRMCLRVCPKGVTGDETHVAVYAYLMQGPFDKHLHWPFMGDITVQLVNQAGDHGHVERVIRFTDKTPDRHSRRVKGKEVSESGWGKNYFLAHEDLWYNALKETQYLKNHHIVIRVVKIIIM